MTRKANQQIVSVYVDAETWIRLQTAREANIAALGGVEISKSVFYRRLLARAMQDPTPAVDAGFVEGYYAGYQDSMRLITEMTIDFQDRARAGLEAVRGGNMTLGVMREKTGRR